MNFRYIPGHSETLLQAELQGYRTSYNDQLTSMLFDVNEVFRGIFRDRDVRVTLHTLIAWKLV